MCCCPRGKIQPYNEKRAVPCSEEVVSNGLLGGQQNERIYQKLRHRLSQLFNHLVVEPSVRDSIVCAPEKKRRESGQLCPWTLNKQHSSAQTLLGKATLRLVSGFPLKTSQICCWFKAPI